MWPETLRVLAASARDRKDFASAIRLYRLSAERVPSASVSAALAMTQAEAGLGSDALLTLDNAQPIGEGDLRELTRARAYVLLLSADRARALDYIEDAQLRFPGDGVLAQRYRDVLVRLGVPLATSGQNLSLTNQDQVQLYRLAGIGQKAGQAPSTLSTEVYQRAMPPTAFFNDYLLMLCQQGQLAIAVQLAEGYPAKLTLHSLSAMWLVSLDFPWIGCACAGITLPRTGPLAKPTGARLG